MKLRKTIPLFAGILIGSGMLTSLFAESDRNKRELLSKKELTKIYDRNGDGQLDYREKMSFLRGLNDEEKAAYKKHFTGLSQNNSSHNDREHGEREHNDREHGEREHNDGEHVEREHNDREHVEREHNDREHVESRGWFAGGPSVRLIERWKNRREVFYRKKNNPNARSGYRGSRGPIGSNARSGYRGSRGPIGPNARSGYRGSRGPIGPNARSGYRGSRGPIGPNARSGYRGSRGPIGPNARSGYRGSRGPIGPNARSGYRGSRDTRPTQDRGWKRNRSHNEVRRAGRGSASSKRSQAQGRKRDRSRGNIQTKHKNRRVNRR
jgi:hypothetical protein